MLNFQFAFVCILYATHYAFSTNSPGGGYGGYTMRCPQNANPLASASGQAVPCQNDGSCGNGNYYCQASPIRNQPGVCCPYCPNGYDPKVGADNKTQTCTQASDCGSPNYICAAGATGKPKSCCPLCPGGAPPTKGDNGQNKPCQSDTDCCTEGSQYCMANPVLGQPKLCCPACPAGGSPLTGQNDPATATTCTTDQSCNSPAHYCQKPLAPSKPSLCCPQCPCGSPPLTNTDGGLLPCQTDQCCLDPTYYCFVSNVTGKASVCCPKPDSGPQPEPQTGTTPSPVGPVTDGGADPTDYVPPTWTDPAQPGDTTTPAGDTTTVPAGDTTTVGAATVAPGTPAQQQGTSRSTLTWESMFTTHKQRNPSFAIPAQSAYKRGTATMVPTSGQFKPCTRDADCYDSREPSEWCRSMPKYNWVGQGCVCGVDSQPAACVIAREEVATKRRDWTFCQLEAQFRCI